MSKFAPLIVCFMRQVSAVPSCVSPLIIYPRYEYLFLRSRYCNYLLSTSESANLPDGSRHPTSILRCSRHSNCLRPPTRHFEGIHVFACPCLPPTLSLKSHPTVLALLRLLHCFPDGLHRVRLLRLFGKRFSLSGHYLWHPDGPLPTVFIEYADVVRDGRTCLARSNSQARAGTGKRFFLFS